MTKHAEKSGTVIDRAAGLRDRLALEIGTEADAFEAIAAASALLYEVTTAAVQADPHRGPAVVNRAVQMGRDLARGDL